MTTRPHHQQRAGHGGRRVAVLAAVCAAAALLGMAWAAGMRAFVVETPSMGTAAPVGTLVITAPVALPHVAVGDIVTYAARGGPTTYTHRVIENDGTRLVTQGDLSSAPDGWRPTQDDLVGRAVVVAPVLGWVLKALPWLLIGGPIIVMLVRRVRPAVRAPAAITLSSLLFAVCATWLRPFVGAQTLGWSPDPGGGARISVVATGLLPLRAQATGGGYADLRLGELAWVHATAADAAGRYEVIPRVHLGLVGTLICVAFCLIPLAASLLVVARQRWADRAPQHLDAPPAAPESTTNGGPGERPSAAPAPAAAAAADEALKPDPAPALAFAAAPPPR